MKIEEILDYIEFVKYQVSTVKIVLQGETLDILPEFVSEVMIEYDYDNLYSPIITIGIALTQEEYKKIVQQKDTVKFIVKIDENYYDSDRNLLHTGGFINETFCTHIIDENPIMEQDLVEMTRESNNNDDDNDRTPMDMRDICDFALFIEENVKSGNKDFNLVVKSASVNDIISYVLSNAGISNVLMTPADNKSKMSNMLFPIMNTVETFNYIQSIKGIYNKGLLFFMDFNRNYFI